MGLLLASEKQYKAAAVQFEAANALQPETFEILYNLGNAYFLSGQYSQAELVVNRALKAKQESVDGLYLLGEIYSRQQRPLDALDALVRAHKLAPENTDVIFLLARVSMSQNYFEDAIPLLEAGVKIAPGRADLHAALGESYFMAGKTEKAIEQFQTDRDRSFRGLLLIFGAVLPPLGTIRGSQKIFSGGTQARSSQRFLPVQPRLYRGAPGK